MQPHTTQSGITCLDEATGGYPTNVFNVIETPDHQSGLLALGHFLMAGLEQGERCTLVTLEDPHSLFQGFSSWNMNFQDYLKSEQLTYLYYQPFVTTEIGLTNDYEALMYELDRLSAAMPERVALHQVDSLLNMHSHTLINNCVQKLAAAANGKYSTYLGQYVQFNSRAYRDVRIAFLKSMPGFYTLKALETAKTQAPAYRLSVDRVPWFRSGQEDYLVTLEKGRGFVPLAPSGGADGQKAA